MKRSSYGERDYAFGQAMLTLRTALGLTQAGLAELLHVSRRAVGEWEVGSSYPKAEHLKQLIELAVKQQAFPAGREEEEIRAFWQAAHQKMLLDESWLSTLLSQLSPSPVHMEPVQVEQTRVLDHVLAPAVGPRVDWGEALDVPSFYGREGELATLSRWVLEEGCRMVSVLGMGGMGKSALVVSTMQRLAAHFEVVLFRSLRDAPDCSALLESCLQVLAPEPLVPAPQGLEQRLSLLLEELRRSRILLVLDNLEVLLEEGDVLGRLRPGYEGYGRLLRQVAQTAHPSCLLLTSREKPAELRALEGRNSPVRSLRLLGLEATACEQLLAEHELVGSPQERMRLVERYEGNPLALNIVAETITDLFAGAIGPFLAQDALVFGSISDLLDEQFGRLSALEQTLLYWLAIAREPLTLEELGSLLMARLAPVQVLEAVDGLRRRSLIERGQRPGSFTLQSVVLEYVSAHLVAQASQEIEQGRLWLLIQHGLEQAQAKDYVRQTQQRLLVVPLLARLESASRGHSDVEERLRFLLDQVRTWAEDTQGYGPANLVTLLRVLRGNLHGLDVSRLVLRGVYLQGVEMQEANLSGTLMRESVFTETFDAISAVAISSSGQYWAAGSRRGEVRVWREAGQILHLVWQAQAHTTNVITLAFSPDERTLASASFDGSITLWDVASGAPLWLGWHTKGTNWLAFAPDGGMLASGSNDASVRLWDPLSGRQLETLPHPGPVFAVSWSPDGRLLASGGFDGHIRLWEIQKTQSATCVQTLSGHSNWVRGLAFAPDGSRLASASWDGSVKLWEVREERSPRVCQTLTGHTERVHCVAWSSDGHTLASGSFDHTIRLWDGEEGRARVALQGHSAVVNGLAFTPDSRSLLSGSEDATLRLWDVESGESLRVLRGYAASLLDVAWSPDGTQLASGGSDTLVTIWDVAGRGGGTLPRVLRGHRWTVYGVGWSPDGSRLASSGWDNAIRLWDPATGTCVQVLRDLDHPDTIFFGMAWSPDGRLLASGAYQQGVLVWDVTKRDPRLAGCAYVTWIRRVAWSPDGTRLVGGGEDGNVYVWDPFDGTQFLQLSGHHGAIMSVTWSPDGTRLASVGGSQGQGDGGELFVWDAHSGELVHAFEGHPGVVTAVTWDPSGERLISGGSDGRLRWWEVHSGECVREPCLGDRYQEAHQGTVQSLKVSPDGSRLASCGDDRTIALWDLYSGKHLQTLRRDRPYEHLDITGIRGLTEAQKATLRTLGAMESTPVPGIQHAP
ncbi:MAG: helix-turn-helix domain-containing protein [Ktedonobacteraceae bacterium]